MYIMDMNESSETDRTDCFKKILRDMVNDLMRTFPELENTLDKDLKVVWKNSEYDMDTLEASYESILTYCKGVFPERFFDILYQNEEMFINEDLNLCFLPGIDYRALWKEDISDNTRETIWKYLQLFLFSILSNVNDGKSFGDTADLFKAINEDVFKTKLESTINEMKNMFSNMETGGDEKTVPDNLPDAESIHDHVAGMMEGKLGSLAKEIAEETAANMNIDMNNVTSINDVFSNLLKDPSKLTGMIKNVGSKLDEKIKSGDIKESELLEEASEMMKKMKTMPGMENIQSILSKMGLGGKGKVNHAAMQAQMEKNINQAKQKEKMRQKAEQNKKLGPPPKTQEELNTAYKESEKVVNELLKDYENEIFRSGEKAERSETRQKPKGNKKNKGKKHK